MDLVLIVIHLLIIIALIIVVLMQRSEGGALGIGGGGGGGGLMTGRGAANALTKLTAGLATAFIVMSIILAIRGGTGSERPSSVTEQPVTETPGAPAAPEDDTPTAPTAPTD